MFDDFINWKEFIDIGSIQKLSTIPDLFAKFQKVYVENFGIEICLTCPSGAQAGWDLFVSTYNNKLKLIPKTMITENSQFVFKKNALIYSSKSHTYYGNANITDDLALQLLKESADNIRNFEKFPDNWKEMLKGVKPLPSILDIKAKENAKKNADTLTSLKAMDVAQLQHTAHAHNLNAHEWQLLVADKDKMVAYVYKKLTGCDMPDDDEAIDMKDKIDGLRIELMEKTVPQLKEMAGKADLPPSEWGALTKNPLIEYLIKKIIAAADEMINEDFKILNPKPLEELKDIAAGMQLPEADWKDLDHDALVEYLISNRPENKA